jgi:hypothetical protein
MIGGDKSEDIMESLLSAKDGDEEHPALDELNCLIYRAPEEMPEDSDEPSLGQPSWKASQDNVSVQIWESKANIRIKVSSADRDAISMNRIAEIAVQAIMDELKKDAG